ncbi:luciferin sulfotransferase [Halyomorpha halys]|uniref:luciferin sulfotransferase n=1 Tax=Halyomorpha halys TaxID=286706 RepID=UPI0006D4D5E7|nr:sulfotransferase 1C4-like [Halyomorpha halys]
MLPYKIVPVEEALNRQLMNDFKGERYGFVQVGPKKWLLPASYADHAEKFYSYDLRSDDVWVITYPRSGTTLCQELVWLLNNNMDFETSANVAMEKRFPFFEFTLLHTEKFHAELRELNKNDPVVNEKLAYWKKPVYEMDLASPRHIKTHLPFSLLPPDLCEKSKVIYVARNPKDVAVSYYHHNRLLRVHDYQGDFPKYWKYFQDDLLVFSPYWEHIKEGWEARHKKNVLFLFYEDIVKNMSESIKKTAEFLGKNITESDVQKLCAHLNIDNFRKVVTVHENIPIIGAANTGEQGFLRRGKVGGNTEFTDEMNKTANEWIKKNLSDTDLKFPCY